MTRITSTADTMMRSLWLPRDKTTLAVAIALTAASIAAPIGTPEHFAWSLPLAFALSWAAFVDLDRFILPDVLTLGLLACGIVRATSEGLASAQPYLIGAVGGYLALAALAAGYKRLRKRAGLGMGDAKLLAVAGAWLGWTALPFVLLLASLSCLVVVGGDAALRRRGLPEGPVPFGPYLAGAIWVMWLVQIGSSH